MIKAIWIDVDNTLLNFPRSAKKAMELVLEEDQIPMSKQIYEAFLDINDELWAQIEQGKMTVDDLRHVRWQKIFAKVNIDHPDPVSFEKRFRTNLAFAAEEEEGAVEALKILQKQYPLFVQTNGNHDQQISRLKQAGLLSCFQDVYSSSLLGAMKPSVLFFNAALEKCRQCLNDSTLSPENIVIIGDSFVSDMKGAQEFNAHSIHYGTAKFEHGYPGDVQADRWEDVVVYLEQFHQPLE